MIPRLSTLRLRPCLLPALALLLSLAGCARAPRVEPAPGPLFFPPPPLPARVQFLGSVSSPLDLPRPRSGFADFILGPPPLKYPLVKPLAAALRDGKLYVCDSVLNTVIIYNLLTGEAGLLPGDAGNGKLQQANNLEFDEQGNLYVADKKRQAVLVYDARGAFVRAVGRPGEAEPVDMAPAGGLLYVCDIKDHQIEVWDAASGALVRQFGSKGNGKGEFYLPSQVALGPDGNLYVTDTGNFRVQKLTPEGEFLATVGGHGTALGNFAWPKGLGLDGDGRLYVADSRFANVQIFDPEGRLLLFFGGPGPTRGHLDLPAGLSVMPWPEAPWLRERLAAGFVPEWLVIVVSQKGDGMVNFFAVASDDAPAP
ncbi:MAG TPA: hypothetical protein PLS90_05130 [Candidatus Sumerlaeota bacterium]|nr:hypothetical protein [Candidatus Sumerlaeota bacterium]